MQFKTYQHIERLGTEAVEGILNGTVHVFPKLDGMNCSIFLDDDGKMAVATRNRVLTGSDDCRGLKKYVAEDDAFESYLKRYPNRRLYGEWLVPHAIRYYTKFAWKQIYIFDVTETDEEGNERYLTYDEYFLDLTRYVIQYIPRFGKLENPTKEEVLEFTKSHSWMTEDNQPGEGLVIKNYDFVNKFGEVKWAKYVNPSTKALCKTKGTLEGDEIEPAIIETFLTPELIEKEFAKIVAENGGWENKLIGKFLGVTWYVFINEETFNILKKFKNPKINFRFLHGLAVEKIKEVKSEIFVR